MTELLNRQDHAEADRRSPVIRVAEEVIAAVREGHLAPGQRLIEANFAKRLGVARSTVREAFQRLEAEGLLSLERHRGFLVRVLTRERLRDIFQIRESLDGSAARVATPRFGSDIRRLETIVNGLEVARRDRSMRDFTRLNHAFHDLIRRQSGNDLIPKLLGSLEQCVYYYQFRLLVETQNVFQSQDEHIEIYEAIKSGDCDAAEAAARRHTKNSLEELLQLPDHYFSAK